MFRFKKAQMELLFGYIASQMNQKLTGLLLRVLFN